MPTVYNEPAKPMWPQLIQRAVLDTQPLEEKVEKILTAIKQWGDEAVKEYSLQFDGVELQDFAVSPAEFAVAAAEVPDCLKAAIAVAKNNITVFHQAQQEQMGVVATSPGVDCWRKWVPIQNVGLYIPGGTAPLFSTLLMLGIPATLAGCTNIVVCTPCNKEGKVNAVVLYVASLLGLKQVYKIGGVQAIGAMAYGTQTVPAVYKIFGPGNQYVTCAKQLVNKQGLAIDMPAGPSEVAIYADETANPAFVAADLLSQAEHGADSQVLLVAANLAIVAAVEQAVTAQLALLPRRDIAAQALQHSRYVVLHNADEAFDLLNAYAAEHLIIASNHAAALAQKVINAGSVFLGHYSPESVGDYASGTNHTLPTNGYAKAYSGVSLDSFVKKITFQQLSPTGLQQIGPAVELMAAAEGLQAHKNAVTIRLNSL
jgi:histidinol dehydrogenase